MTSASELFYTRRSRQGRTDSELGSDPSLSRSIHHRRHDNSRHQHQHSHLHRHPHVRQFCLRDRASGHSVNRNAMNAETQRNTSVNGNERLPGAVLLARERLFERLRGVSAGNRQSSRASSQIQQTEPVSFHDLPNRVDSSDWPSILTELTSQIETFPFSREPNRKPHGLTQDAINRLNTEKFSVCETDCRTRDCSICLESFTEGETLIRLPCTHRFHSPCLDPWVRTCGDCPYCRRAIVIPEESL